MAKPRFHFLAGAGVKYAAESSSHWRHWLKRLGLAGFVFFLVKGLLWLLVPALLFYPGFGS